MTITLRDLQEKDLNFLVEVRNECKDFLHNASEFSIDSCKKWFNDTKPKFFLIEKENAPIGYFRTSEWTDNSCFVGGDLHKDYRGKGYMKIAYPLLFEKLLTLNIKTVFLSVLEFNVRAISLYKKLGFEELSKNSYTQLGSNKNTINIDMKKVLKK
ncbi:MAG: GNAT family N-acetyltransferase [Proteobacteria bacterium]|nr:GNAT family N-acetyltransferase [Pseudomonadota bacterium]